MENFAGAPVVRCRGGDSQARPRSGIRTAKSIPCTVPCARPLMCHCEEQSDVAISGRQLQSVQAIADRMQYCRGGDSRTRHCTGGKCGLILKKAMAPKFVIARRPTADVAISRNRSRFRLGFPDIRHGTARLPRPLRGLAMTNPGAITVLAIARANRSCSAGPGCPLPCIFPFLNYSISGTDGVFPAGAFAIAELSVIYNIE